MYSRLVLCKTYRLDEDGKVLTPEEILYRVRHLYSADCKFNKTRKCLVTSREHGN